MFRLGVTESEAVETKIKPSSSISEMNRAPHAQYEKKILSGFKRPRGAKTPFYQIIHPRYARL